jgi:osmoprotectant transport system ATP-binding protein
MIELDRVSKHYGSKAAVDDLSLGIARGELFVLIGPSGSGKSTALKLINRLIGLSSGAVRIDGQDVRDVEPVMLRRRIGYVFQSIGLFPHWTVERNICTVPELLGWTKAKMRDRATQLLSLLHLDPALFRHKYPHQLSGGEQQRVGVARALAAEPEILLMDEPFGALDPITRAALQEEIARIHAESRTTIVFVTHDMDEALRLASRIAIMAKGRLVQAGTPVELLSAPATDFVRDFIGREDLGVRLLSLQPVASRLRQGEAGAGEPIPASANLRQALSEMIAQRTDRLPVIDENGHKVGALALEDLALQ